MSLITLLGGKKVSSQFVTVSLYALEAILHDSPHLLYDLIRKCKDGNYFMSLASERKLTNLGYLKGGKVEEDVRNLVRDRLQLQIDLTQSTDTEDVYVLSLYKKEQKTSA